MVGNRSDPAVDTALLPLVIFPLVDNRTFAKTAAPFASGTIFLFMGGFFLAASIQVEPSQEDRPCGGEARRSKAQDDCTGLHDRHRSGHDVGVQYCHRHHDAANWSVCSSSRLR